MPGPLHVTKRPTGSTRGYFSYAVRSVDYLETVRRRLVRLYEQARNRTPERREYRRRYAEEQRQRAKLLGKCQNGSKPAIPGHSRCETCAEAHRQSPGRSDANRRAADKETRRTGLAE